MNFTPFGGHFPATIPTIHQFAAKFGHENNPNAICQPPETNSSRYTANGVPSFTQHHPPQQHMVNTAKYQGATYMNQSYSQQQQQQSNQNQQQQQQQQQGPQQHQSHDKRQNSEKQKDLHQDDRRNHHQQQQQAQQSQLSQQNNQLINTATTAMPSTWQSLAAPGSTVADYLSHLPASTLPLSLHHFLKYSAEIKKEATPQQLSIPGNDPNINLLPNVPGAGIQNSNLLSANIGSLSTINHAQLQNNPPAKKKKKKKPEKEKKPKPKPGEIRLTTALDGSTLYCCPECHMAYPEKELLEQHLVGHTLERRFVCDICGAGLKRKDHLTRHKQSHNPERPYVCTVCLKAFKRKEQLTLHFVIHSGEKRHICTECGKGFYRKDHLRKHTRSHIARRVKAELSQQGPSNTSGLQLPSASGSAQSIMS